MIYTVSIQALARAINNKEHLKPEDIKPAKETETRTEETKNGGKEK